MVICSHDLNEVQRVQGLTLFEHLLCPATMASGSIGRAQVFQSDSPRGGFNFHVLEV